MSGQGKTAIVTGASQGIGAGIVKGFEQHPVRQHSRGHCAEYRGRYFRGVDIY
jgi:NADP-dependent 3-hydroxy acid dehydrogenase YdfG